MIPASWEPLDRPPTQAALDALEHANAGVLGFFLQRVDLATAPRPGDEGLTEALAPLRAKLDLIIEMLSGLSYRQVVLPDPQDIELALDHIIWTVPSPLAAGQWLKTRLYFSDAYREPVTLYTEVAGSAADGEGGWRVHGALPEMSESVGESFARLIFFEQRRRLAQRPARVAVGSRQ